MKTTLKLPIILIAAALMGGGLLWATGLFSTNNPSAKATAAAPPPVPVSVATVIDKSVTEWDEFSGRVQPVDRVEIRPQVSGLIVAVHFDEGQMVKKGDPLFTIDPRPFQAELTRAQAALEGAQAKLILAQANLIRSKELFDTHTVARSELDQNNDAYMEADANLKSAQATLQAAQINLDYTAIASPVTGRVSRAEITVGNLVEAGANAPLLTTVVSVSPVYVEFEIDEQTYLKYLANGAEGNSGLDHIPVSMELADEEGYPRRGRLKSIDNRLDTTSGTIRVRAVFDNSTGDLTPGLYAKVRTAGSAAETAVLVDDRAVGTDQDKKYVMVVDAANRVNYRAVTLGPVVNGLRIVRSGLQKGERIVIDGLQSVRPGQVIVPENVAMERHQENQDIAASVGK
jgi:multidrug efflux system membrane fusion protein